MSTLIANLPPVVALRYHDSERFNIAAGSKKFDCKFLEPGFVSYRDIPGGKLELLRKQTIERAMDTAVGIPLTIGHTMVTAENRVNLENGVVTGWYFNSEDGWYHVTGTVDTDEALQLIRKGHRPSCGFKVLDLAPGGRDHGIRFDQEIADLVFNHLAIVERPRYAEADFRLNSITSVHPTMNVFKFLRKLVTTKTVDGKPVEEISTVPHEASGNTEVEIDGKMVRLNELFDAYLKETAEAFTITPDTALEVSGKAVTMGQMADAYRKNQARTNSVTETPEQKLARETKEAADKKTADDQRANEIAAADQKKKDDEAAKQRENDAGKSAFFTLHAARQNPKTDAGFSTTSGSLKEKCELGAKRY